MLRNGPRLETFRARHTGNCSIRRSDAAELLLSQSDIDGTAVRSSFTMLRVLIWAIPILGFIGTVIGLQEAISGFAGLNDITRLQEQLAVVTGGLGSAFQATLIALMLSLFLMFPTSASERAEWRLLNYLDDFCNDQILPRLVNEEGQQQDAKAVAVEAGEAFAVAMTEAIPTVAAAIRAELLASTANVYGMALRQEMEAMEERIILARQAFTNEIKTVRDELQQAVKQSEVLTKLAAGLPASIASALDTTVRGAFDGLSANLTAALKPVLHANENAALSSARLIATLTEFGGQFEAIHDRTTTVETSFSLASRQASESFRGFADSLQTTETSILSTMADSQAALRDSASALREATEAVCDLVKHVDASRELDTIRTALDRVAGRFTNGYNHSQP